MKNPFDFVHADPWVDDAVDVKSIHANVSRAILESIETVRTHASRGESELLSTRCYLLLGPAGVGKTHLLFRLRQSAKHGASFVLLRPDVGVDVTARIVLTRVIESLNRRSLASDMTQLDALVGSILAFLEGRKTYFPQSTLEEFKSMQPEHRELRLREAIDTLAERDAELQPVWLEKLIRMPFLTSSERVATRTWLSGRDCTVDQLERIGLNERLPESDALPALRSLIVVASHVAPLVIVFDQLENLVDQGESSHIHAHAQFVADLVDTTRGAVVVQMALDSEWEVRIRPQLSAALRTRLEGDRRVLSLPTPSERKLLVNAWLDRVPDKPAGLFTTPTSFAALERMCHEPGVTPRQLLIWCRDAVEAERNTEAAIAESTDEGVLDAHLERTWQQFLTSARAQLDETAKENHPLDGNVLAAGLISAVRRMKGHSLEMHSARDGFLLAAKGAAGECRVMVLQQGHGTSVGRAMDRANEISKTHDVLVVRERTSPFPASWKTANEALARFQKQPRGRFVWLESEDVAKLIALSALVAAARSQDVADTRGTPLPESQVIDWIDRTLGVSTWPSAVQVTAAFAPAKT